MVETFFFVEDGNIIIKMLFCCSIYIQWVHNFRTPTVMKKIHFYSLKICSTIFSMFFNKLNDFSYIFNSLIPIKKNQKYRFFTTFQVKGKKEPEIQKCNYFMKFMIYLGCIGIQNILLSPKLHLSTKSVDKIAKNMPCPTIVLQFVP